MLRIGLKIYLFTFIFFYCQEEFGMGRQGLKKKRIRRRNRQWQKERRRDEKIISTNISISFMKKSEKYIILCVAAQIILPAWVITMVGVSFIVTLVTWKCICCFFGRSLYFSHTSKWWDSLCISLLFLSQYEAVLNYLVPFDFLKCILNFCFKLHSDFKKWLLV